MALYPFLEQWATGDKSHHHLLDRPRNAPTRTAIGTMSLSFYLLLWAEGGNDLIARITGQKLSESMGNILAASPAPTAITSVSVNRMG